MQRTAATNRTPVGPAGLVLRWVVSSSLLLGVCAGPAYAQASANDENLRAFLARLSQVTEPTAAEVNSGIADTVLEALGRFPDEVTRLVGVSIFSVPAAASSAGFSYDVDPSTGDLMRRSNTLGPTFIERPVTNGQGIWNTGVSFQAARFDEFNGISIDTDNVGRRSGLFIIENEAIFPDGDTQFVHENILLSVRSVTTNFFASYGVSDNLDIGIVVPFSNVQVEGRRVRVYDLHVTAELQGDDFEFDTPIGFVDQPANNCPLCVPYSSMSASGIGDLVARARWAFVRTPNGAGAVAIDLGLPTGDVDNLLGQGETWFKVMAIGSVGAGPATFHGQAGYTAGGLTDQLHFGGSADVTFGPSNRLTASLEVIGQVAQDTANLDIVRTLDSVGTTGIRGTLDRALWTEDSLSLLRIAPGFKVHVGATAVISASMLIQVSDEGFRSRFTPVIGFDWGWSGSR